MAKKSKRRGLMEEGLDRTQHYELA
ncbi:uncharacterized protein METZ01_LOCUS495714, partial [marine metagenome]